VDNSGSIELPEFLALGRAVQVDPIKPVLKAPRCTLLKPRYDGLHSNLAFTFNLRR
jgi:hypothetical protein